MASDLILEEFDVLCYGKNAKQPKHQDDAIPLEPSTIKVWKLTNSEIRPGVMPVIISSGFGRAMDQMGVLANNIASNGIPVYRYDSLDHVGMSDGEMIDFTLSVGLISLEAVIDWVSNRHDGSKIALVSTSMTARIAYRLASYSNRLSCLITAVGVVNVRDTLKNVLGEDFLAYKSTDLPPTLEFERQSINALSFYKDSLQHDWSDRPTVEKEINCVNIPINSFIASEDDWVTNDDVKAVLLANPNSCIYLLNKCKHNFGKNLSSVEYFTKKVLDLIFSDNNILEGDTPIIVGFEAFLDQSIKERRIQRAFQRRQHNRISTKIK